MVTAESKKTDEELLVEARKLMNWMNEAESVEQFDVFDADLELVWQEIEARGLTYEDLPTWDDPRVQSDG